MAVKTSFIRYGLISAATVVLLVVFNRSRPPLETATQAAFVEWYQDATTYLLHWSPGANPPRAIAARVKLVSDAASAPAGEWLLPDGTLEDDVQRDRLMRVLELIKESRVYGNSSYLADTPPTSPHLALEVQESGHTFTAYVPLTEIDKSIQMKNLLKLLEVFRLTPPAKREINPSQT